MLFPPKIIISKANKDPVVYTGVFFDRASLYDLVSGYFGDSRLYRDVLYPHITFQYAPQTVHEDLFGEKAGFRVVGYGNNGQNEGLFVEWLSGSSGLKQLFDEIQVPHITLSYAENGRAVNTRYLDFEPVTPFNISGVFGGFLKSGNNAHPAESVRSTAMTQ